MIANQTNQPLIKDHVKFQLVYYYCCANIVLSRWLNDKRMLWHHLVALKEKMSFTFKK